ncbi:MAG: GldG family protein [Thiolinea sp.]
MKMTRRAHRFIHLQNAVFYVLFAVVIGLLAFFSRQFSYQADWTYGNRNSLSETTHELLNGIAAPLKFVAYVPDDPALQEQLRKLVAKYQRIRGDIGLEFVNPDLDPVRARQDGIQYAGQLAIHLGTKTEVVESTGESVIANALQRMSRGAERLVVFLEGHDERDPLAEHSSGMSQFVELIKRSGFRVQPHNLVRSQSVPDNARFLVIAAPQKALLEGEVKVVTEYVEQGGNLLWLHDPESTESLDELAGLLGIQLGGGTVVDANEHLHALLGIDHPAVVPVVDYGRSVLGEKLTGSQSLFPFSTMVARLPKPDEGALVWQIDEFLNTLPNSWLESGEIEGDIAYIEEDGDQLGPITIGLALTRLLDAPVDGSTNAAVSETMNRGDQQRVVVVGDSDFMLNSFIGQGVNVDLATNIFNWLSADDNLLNIKTSSAPDTHLEMGEKSSLVLAVFFLIVLPLLLITTGVVIWLRRRRR